MVLNDHSNPSSMHCYSHSLTWSNAIDDGQEGVSIPPAWAKVVHLDSKLLAHLKCIKSLVNMSHLASRSGLKLTLTYSKRTNLFWGKHYTGLLIELICLECPFSCQPVKAYSVFPPEPGPTAAGPSWPPPSTSPGSSCWCCPPAPTGRRRCCWHSPQQCHSAGPASPGPACSPQSERGRLSVLHQTFCCN